MGSSVQWAIRSRLSCQPKATTRRGRRGYGGSYRGKVRFRKGRCAATQADRRAERAVPLRR